MYIQNLFLERRVVIERESIAVMSISGIELALVEHDSERVSAHLSILGKNTQNIWFDCGSRTHEWGGGKRENMSIWENDGNFGNSVWLLALVVSQWNRMSSLAGETLCYPKQSIKKSRRARWKLLLSCTIAARLARPKIDFSHVLSRSQRFYTHDNRAEMYFFDFFTLRSALITFIIH